MRNLALSLLFAATLHAQTMPTLAPAPAGSKPIVEPDPTGKMAKHYGKAIGQPYGMFRYGNSAFIAVNSDDMLDTSYDPGKCGYNGFVGNGQLKALASALTTLQSDGSIAHIF